MASETTDLGTVAYQYDVVGRRTRMTVNDLNPVTYTYDAASRPRTITQAPLSPVDIQYDAVGRRTRLTLSNNVSTEYQYDAASRLTALIYRNATSQLGDLSYTYDATGNRTGVGGSFARTLVPDPIASATYDAANRQLTFSDKALTYDANGNLSSITEPSGVTTFTWDARNRLTGLAASGATGTFVYDALGRRATKTVSGSTTQYLYDGLDITQQLDPLGATSYLRSLNLDEALASTNAGDTHFSIHDPLGSTLAVLDQAASQVTQYTYDPFGKTTSNNPAFRNALQYTSRENDSPLELYYYRARFYSPETGRFVNEDSIGIAGGLNLYAYGSNNPGRFNDPLGLAATLAVGGSIQGGFLARVAFLQQGALVIDTKGNVGIYKTTLPSGNVGFEGVTTCLVCASGAGFVQLSNARDIVGLVGPFDTSSGTINFGAPVLGTFAGVEADRSSNVEAISVVGGAGMTYPGLPFSLTGVKTTTEVIRLFNIFDVLRGIQTALGSGPGPGGLVLGRRK